VNALLNVIRAELYKALRKRRTYLLAFLLWVLLPVLVLFVGRILQTNLTGSFVDESGTVDTVVQQIASPFGISRIGLMLPALSSPSFILIIISLLAALLIGEERTQNMWKTTLTAQPNRLLVLSGKLIVAMLLYGLLLLGAYLSGVLFGGLGRLFLDTTFGGAWGGLFGLYLLQWLFGLAATLFAFLMIFLLRNIALGIVTVFFLPALLEGLYTIYRTTVGFQPLNRLNAIFQALRLRQTLENLPRFFFTRNLYAPAREPLAEVVRAIGGDPGSGDMGPLTDILGGNITLQHAALVMAGYALLFGGVLVWLFMRRDVS